MVDNLIKLFESTATSFDTNGLGVLSDAATCIVKEERNGAFELTMTYPINGQHYSDISLRKIIFAKPNPYDNPQAFRIYGMSKPLNGMVTINAEHISYDLSGCVVAPFEATNIMDAFTKLKASSVAPCPFIFNTDKTTQAKMTVDTPASIRSLLGGTGGSILDVYGTGEYIFDNYNVTLKLHRGSDNGVSIRYGKNLTDINQEENCSSVYTGVYPYWWSNETGIAQLAEKVVNAEGTYDFVRILPLDLTTYFGELPSEDQLRAEARRYMEDNDIGVPKVSIDVSFAQLAQSEEYESITLLEKVQLCDTVTVEFPELNVSATAKCISTEYDVLTNKYTTISLGDAKSTLAKTISSQNQAINDQYQELINQKDETISFMEKAIAEATSLITGGQGGYVLINSSKPEYGGRPDEILIMDTPDINTAKDVWRWNSGGLGHSSNGYNGPFPVAITQKGEIIADYIKAGTMSANRIAGGVFVDEIEAKKFKMTGGNIQITTKNSPGSYTNFIEFVNDYGFKEKMHLAPNGLKVSVEGITTEPRFEISPDGFYGYAKGIEEYQADEASITLSLENQRLHTNIPLNCYNQDYSEIVFGSSQYGGYAKNFSCENLHVTGTKNRSVETKTHGTRLLSAYETAEPMFGDVGIGSTDETGSTTVDLDEIFLETIEPDTIIVFLTQYDKGNIYVSNVTDHSFAVSGDPNIKFAWEAKAIQNGYKNNRLNSVTEVK